MFGGQEVVLMRAYTVIACPVCRRQADGLELRCLCAEVFDGLDPVEVQTVAVDDPQIIVPPDHARTATRS